MDWDDLGQSARELVEAHTGSVIGARTASAGLDSQLAVALETDAGQVFVKGLRTDHPGVVRQRREAMINPHVVPLAPRLRWQAEGAGWNLLAFDYLPGTRHADYTPGSADLPVIVQVLDRLQQMPCPDLPVKRAEQRWAAYLDDDAARDLLAGQTLLHTDFNPLNVLMDDGAEWIIDWAWPTRGAAFIDPACLLLRLMLACCRGGRGVGAAMRFLGNGAGPGSQCLRHRLRAPVRRDRPQGSSTLETAPRLSRAGMGEVPGLMSRRSGVRRDRRGDTAASACPAGALVICVRVPRCGAPRAVDHATLTQLCADISRYAVGGARRGR